MSEFPRLRQLVNDINEVIENADFLRECIGECHLMISRNTAEFQIRQDWDSATLPARVAKLIREIERLKTEGKATA